MRRSLPLVVLASACSASPDAGVDLLVPDDVEFAWNSAYNDVGDGRLALLPLDVMVYDAVDGEPVEGVVVRIDAEEVDFVGASLVEAALPSCEACPWDAYRDEYVDLEADAVVTQLDATSDASGLVQVLAVLDHLSLEGGVGEVAVRVSLAGDAVQAREPYLVRLLAR